MFTYTSIRKQVWRHRRGNQKVQTVSHFEGQKKQ